MHCGRYKYCEPYNALRWAGCWWAYASKNLTLEVTDRDKGKTSKNRAPTGRYHVLVG
jgi:hypothetical protein